MNLQKKLIAAFIVIMLLFVLSNEIVDSFYASGKAKEEWHAQNRINLDMLLELQMQSMQLLALQLANDAAVKEAFVQNDPQRIIKEIGPFWEHAKTEMLLYEIHFFKPPAISFVNFSNFSSIGTDVADVRSDITWITSTFEGSCHLMMCKTYAGIRATYPIMDENKTILGGVSLGKKVDWIPTVLNQMTHKDVFLVYTQASAKSLAGKYYRNFLQNKESFGRYLFAERTGDVPIVALSQIDFSKPIQDLKIDNRHYSVNLYPLLDFDHKVMGYVGVLNDMEQFYSKLYGKIQYALVTIIIVAFLAFLFFRYLLDRLLRRIEGMKALTQSFKNSEFDRLDAYDLEAMETRQSKDQLVELEFDILRMGEGLRSYYERVDEIVQQQTFALSNANKQLEKQLYYDGLTGLPNRYSFFRDLSGWDTPSLAIININRFKVMNDLYGVEIGNRVLKGLADFCLEKMQGKGLLTYRLGADEFAIVSENHYKHVDFEIIILALMHEVSEHHFIVDKEGVEIHMDLTAGINFGRENMVEKADMALDQAKIHKKSHVVFSDALGLHKDNEESIALTKKIKEAISAEGIVTYYQPIVDADGNIAKYETLVRMIDGDHVLSPYHFLEFAKKARYYKEISQIVLERSFRMFEHSDMPFSVNITAEDILDAETIEIIKLKLQHFPKKENVVFEIVETESILSIEEFERFVDEIKAMGAKIAIDDFGSGYSNFSYLLKLSPDYLKIDGSLIKNIHEDANAHAIVRTIVGFSKELGIKTIAEFVHSQEVFEVCKAIGIDEFQGYYFSEPLSKIDV